MKTVLLVLLGFLLHKATYEFIAYKNAVNFIDCLDRSKPGDRSSYQMCAPLLNYSKTEKVFLYQPELWCSKISSFCEDK